MGSASPPKEAGTNATNPDPPRLLEPPSPPSRSRSSNSSRTNSLRSNLSLSDSSRSNSMRPDSSHPDSSRLDLSRPDLSRLSNSSHGTSTRSAHLSVSASTSVASSSSSSSRRRKKALHQQSPPLRDDEHEEDAGKSSDMLSDDVESDKTRWPRGVPLPAKFASTSSSSSSGLKRAPDDDNESAAPSLSSSSSSSPTNNSGTQHSSSSSHSSFSIDVNTPRTLSPPASASHLNAGTLRFGAPAHIPSTDLLVRAARLAAADRANLWAAVSIMRPTMLDGDGLAAWCGRDGVRAAVAHFARRGKRAHVITSSKSVACFARRGGCASSRSSNDSRIRNEDKNSVARSKSSKSSKSSRCSGSCKISRSHKSSRTDDSAPAVSDEQRQGRERAETETPSEEKSKRSDHTGVKRVVDKNAAAAADAKAASVRKSGSSRGAEGEGVSVFPSRALALRALSRAARNGADVISNEWRDRAARRLLRVTGGLSDDDMEFGGGGLDGDMHNDNLDLDGGGGRPGRIVPFLFIGDRFVPQRSSSWSASPSVSVSGVGGVAGSASSSGAASSVRAISQRW